MKKKTLEKISLSSKGQKIPAISKPQARLRYTTMVRISYEHFSGFRSGEMKVNKIVVLSKVLSKVQGLDLNIKSLLKAKCCPRIPIQTCFQVSADA